MPHIQVTHAGNGPIADVYVTVSAPRFQALTAAASPIPPPQTCKALVDTGASNTSIDPSITQALGLTPTGTAWVITPTTGNVPVEVPTYDVGVHIGFGNQVYHSKNPTTVLSSALLHQGFGVLLGRDVLVDGMLIYDGKHNVFTLSF